MNNEHELKPGAVDIKSIRLLRPSVVVLIGPAACGKSTFAAHHFRPTQVISSDQARALVCDDERDQRFQAEAFALAHFLIQQRLTLNRLCVVDPTALTHPARHELLDLARRNHVPCVAILLDVSLETCLAHDQGRERTVGRPVVERHHQLFEQVKAGIQQEGFDQVVVLGEKDLDKVRFEVLFRPVQREPNVERRPDARPQRTGAPRPGSHGNTRPERPAAPQRRPEMNRMPERPSPQAAVPAAGQTSSVSPAPRPVASRPAGPPPEPISEPKAAPLPGPSPSATPAVPTHETPPANPEPGIQPPPSDEKA